MCIEEKQMRTGRHRLFTHGPEFIHQIHYVPPIRLNRCEFKLVHTAGLNAQISFAGKIIDLDMQKKKDLSHFKTSSVNKALLMLM